MLIREHLFLVLGTYNRVIFRALKKGCSTLYFIIAKIILSSNAILLNSSLFIFMEHHYFEGFPAVFTRLLWIVTPGVSRDNEINPVSSF